MSLERSLEAYFWRYRFLNCTSTFPKISFLLLILLYLHVNNVFYPDKNIHNCCPILTVMLRKFNSCQRSPIMLVVVFLSYVCETFGRPSKYLYWKSVVGVFQRISTWLFLWTSTKHLVYQFWSVTSLYFDVHFRWT